MKETSHDAATADAPVWARGDAFPPAPFGFGWMDYARNLHPCGSFEELIAAIRDDRSGGVQLVWLPERPHMVLPEELPQASAAVLEARTRRATERWMDSKDRLQRFGLLLAGLSLYLLYQGWAVGRLHAPPGERLGFMLHVLLGSQAMGITLLMFLVFAFIPWYQSHKRLRELGRWTGGDLLAIAPGIRFETWLAWQRAPVTRGLMWMLAMVALAQVAAAGKTTGWTAFLAVFQNWGGVSEAGLVKQAYLHGEWWRLFTAPMLHGNIVHFLMNGLALLYLGKRLEVFARWPHLPLVFLCAMIAGGEASARFLDAPSVGASGGLMGWLGFLLVFESLHGSLVPKSARRRLLAGVVLTAVIGLVGYRFIDNAAHLGGLLAGIVYAGVVFPRSTTANRPEIHLTDKLAGLGALGVLLAAALFAVARLVA